MSDRKYPMKDVKMLYGNASNRCSKCRKFLMMYETKDDPSAQIGKISHIVGHEPKGPRGDPDYPEEELDTYKNWILLCGSCHDEIDVQPNTYSIQDLHEMKEKHEKWVNRQLNRGTLEFGFPELKTAIRNINSGRYSSIDSPSTFDEVLDIKDKIQKNSLNDNIKGLISSTIYRSNEVRKFLAKMEEIDVDFTVEVKNNFQSKYYELKNQNLDADSIFYDLLEFAQGGTTTFSEEAASLAILCHLFELCEVFEK